MAMVSSSASPSLPRQLLRYASYRLGLLLHRSPSPNHPKHVATAAAPHYQEEGHGNINSAAAANVREVDVAAAAASQSLLTATRGPPREGAGGKTNAAPSWKPRGGGRRGPAPPAGGPREGSGGRGGVIHAVAREPTRPGAPAEGTGGQGGIIHAASSSS